MLTFVQSFQIPYFCVLFFLKGYEISCFYVESDKTVTYPMTVSMKSLEPFTELAEMPRCHYEVVDPTSMESLSVVSVGSKLLHKWKCDSTAPSKPFQSVP